MNELKLLKIRKDDIRYFAKWWRDKELVALTSGDFSETSDKEIKKYFNAIINSKQDYHFIISYDDIKIGHISLKKQKEGYEIQIVIGEKNFWEKGIGTNAIRLLLDFANANNILNIFLELRPENKRAIRVYEKAGFVIKGRKKYNTLNMPEVIIMSYSKDDK